MHPIDLCKKLTPMPFTALFPPDRERGEVVTMALVQTVVSTNAESVVKIHLRRATVHDPLNPKIYSDCVVCGQSLDSIKRQTKTHYFLRTTYTGETERQLQSRIDALVAGMNGRTFLFTINLDSSIIK